MDPSDTNLHSPTDESRGRRRNRDGTNPDDADPNGGHESAEGTGNSKKRRRSRKGLDKKFECPHEGCGKSYSRAEHLYRHQLNRTYSPSHFLGRKLSSLPAAGAGRHSSARRITIGTSNEVVVDVTWSGQAGAEVVSIIVGSYD